MSKEWRSGSNRLLRRRSILKHEWPRLIDAMMEDGLHAQITEKGIVFSVKGYRVSPASVREVWGLSEGQGAKLRMYVLRHDPWGSEGWE